MASWSKLPPNYETLSCRTVAHPWTDNCVSAAIYTWFDSTIGAAGFFTLLYSFQFLSTVLKKKKKVDLKTFLRNFLRSIIFGASVSGVTFGTHCLLRKFLGRFYYFSVVFIPACVGGCCIFMETKKGRELYVNAFSNCAIEAFIRLLEQTNVLKLNPNTQTFVFMLLSSALSTLLSQTDFDLNYFWFFIPQKDKNNNNDSNGTCSHNESCAKYISKLFIFYSTTSFILQFAKLLMGNIKNPKQILIDLFSSKTFNFAAFLGGYVVIYQSIRCFLRQKEKKYEYIHDTLAGFLAGIAFRFQPTIPVLNSAIITIIQILTEIGYQKKILPDIPYSQVLFSFLCGILFNFRVMNAALCPQLMVYLMSAITHGMSDRFTVKYKQIEKLLLENVKNNIKKR